MERFPNLIKNQFEEGSGAVAGQAHPYTHHCPRLTPEHVLAVYRIQ
jgi:hypothetical protein